MTIKTELTCPLGSQCEKIVDGTIMRCVWYTQISGLNANTGEQMDEQGCAMTLLPVLLLENARQHRSTAAAVESFRNEMVDSNMMTNQLFLAQNKQTLLDD
jgi:hypothetical protein